MADEHMDQILERVDPAKRDFLKKVVAGTAFAAPLIASFSLDGLSVYQAHAQGASNVSDQ